VFCSICIWQSAVWASILNFNALALPIEAKTTAPMAAPIQNVSGSEAGGLLGDFDPYQMSVGMFCTKMPMTNPEKQCSIMDSRARAYSCSAYF
jgi:hypothetical protein